MLDFLKDIELMTDLQLGLDRAILLYALVAARVAPVVQLVPYFGGKAVPQVVKMGLIIALTALVYPSVWVTGAADALPSSAPEIIILMTKELLLGLMFGFVASLVFESVRIAGQLIDNARGQTMATAMVPQLPERVSVTADYFYQLTIVIFLIVGGHRLFIAAFARSFHALPPQQLPQGGDHLLDVCLQIVRLGADAITLGVLLAFPVIAASLLADMCLGLVNKAAPQIQVFFLGMPIKALLGILVFLLGLHIITTRAIDEALESVRFLQGAVETLEDQRLTPPSPLKPAQP